MTNTNVLVRNEALATLIGILAVAAEQPFGRWGSWVGSENAGARETALSPLFRMALVKGSPQTVLLHLRRGASLNERDDRGLTPLMLAAVAGRQDICSLLISEGADPDKQNPGGLTAAQLAIAAGHPGLASIFVPSLPAPVIEQSEADAIRYSLDAIPSNDWEAEDVIEVGRSPTDLLAKVRSAQVQLGRALPDRSPDWSDIDLSLPMCVAERPLSPALRNWLTEALQGLLMPEEIRRVGRQLPGLTAALDDAGVRAFGDALENWINGWLNERSLTALDAGMQEHIVEAVERLLDPCDSDRIRRREIDRLPHLDRATEQSMFRALGDARRSVLRTLLASATLIEPVSAIEVDTDDETDLDPDFVSILIELRDLGAEDAVERLSQLDLDVNLAERVIERLDRMDSPSGPALKQQLRRYLLARDRVVTAGLPWVEPSAKRYVQRGIELGDLWQAGAIGLMRAAERFNPMLGHRFQTFAIWWIRQGCSRAVADNAHTIRIPVHVQDARRRFRRAEAALKAEGWASPDFARVAGRAELTLERARICLKPWRQISLSRRGLDRWVRQMPDAGSELAMANLHEADRRRHLAAAVTELPEREADIMRRRFGLDGFEAHTLEEVGNHYQLTRERIRQLESKALGRLLKGPHRSVLRELL